MKPKGNIVKHDTASAVSTKAANKPRSMREDSHSGINIQCPRSMVDRLDAAMAALECGEYGYRGAALSKCAMLRMLLDYGLRDLEAGIVEFRFPPGALVRK